MDIMLFHVYYLIQPSQQLYNMWMYISEHTQYIQNIKVNNYIIGLECFVLKKDQFPYQRDVESSLTVFCLLRNLRHLFYFVLTSNWQSGGHPQPLSRIPKHFSPWRVFIFKIASNPEKELLPLWRSFSSRAVATSNFQHSFWFSQS